MSRPSSVAFIERHVDHLASIASRQRASRASTLATFARSCRVRAEGAWPSWCRRALDATQVRPIPPATRAHIFQPCKVESLQQQRNRSGLGLGLHIVNEIVKSHGGQIEIDDAGGFVTFRVVLPLVPSAPAPDQGGDKSGR